MMIRLAAPEDAPQLFLLNEQFNGRGLTTPEAIRQSLTENRQEVVVVAEENGSLQGFVCVQLKRSFCYDRPAAEVTEVYVDPSCRLQGLGKRMLQFAMEHCNARFGAAEWDLLTGGGNTSAQAFYHKLGWIRTGRIHFINRDEKP